MKEMTIFRIEKSDQKHGMWHNENGEYDPIIQEICPNSATKDLPMPYNEQHKKDGLKWFSATSSIENMHYWFSADDAQRLINNGFKLYQMRINMYQITEMEVLFCREGVIESKEIPLENVWKELKTLD